MSRFEDRFSHISSDYARYRPQYPDELFKYLASVVQEHELAWDCGTGNGQAAIGLVPYFRRVVATDASEEQIGRAVQHARITYIVVPAEKAGIESGSVDLIIATQALHWFDLDVFYPEAGRILKPGGVIAATAYNVPVVSPAIDLILRRFHDEVVGPMWLPQNQFIDKGLSTIPFPFDEIFPPPIKIRVNWDLRHLIGYLGTWSGVQRYRKENQSDPIDLIITDLQAAWGPPETPTAVTFPLGLRIGRK